jgi:glycosyltransferase involved in cell wall biosynthesis
VRIAMLGTRGVPPRYGGFETAVDEIGSRLVAAGHEVVVYCRNPGQTQRDHLGMQLVNLPALRRRELETLSHTLLSSVHAATRGPGRRPDVALVFNAANAPLVPLLRAARIPTAVHVDGLEWQRAKWQGLGARYYRAAEKWSVRWADEVVADAVGIADHLRATHGRDAVFIPYGAPLVDAGSDRLAAHGLEPRGYHLVVARFEPENHLDELVDGRLRSTAAQPLVVVGGAPYAQEYETRVRARAAGDDRVRFLGPVYDNDLLDQLYAGAASYLHGHSVGGTNPSLLRAMGAGAPVTAWDVVFNREVTDGAARFVRDADDVAAALVDDERDPVAAKERGELLRERARTAYVWDDVAREYEQLCRRLRDEHGRRGSRPAR